MAFLLRSLSACSMLLALGCGGGGDGGGGGPTQPTDGPRLTLQSDSSTLGLFGVALVTARLVSAVGQPIEGSAIVFSTDLGTLDRTSVATDEDGVAQTRLRGDGRPGTARILARLGTTSTSATLDLMVGGGQSLDVRAGATALAIGGSTTIEVVTVGAGGSPEAGVTVELSTTLGRLESARLRTGPDGAARTTLRAGSSRGEATVTATRTDDGEAASVTVALGAPRTIELSSSASTVPTNGSVPLRALVREPDGAPAGGLVVRFSTTLGRIDDGRPQTDASGVAVTTLRGASRTGTAEVTAAVEGADGPASLLLQIGSSPTLRLSASPSTVTVGNASTITAVVSDDAGAPVPAGTAVSFATDLGTLRTGTAGTDGAGLASTVLDGPTAPGVATVSARVPTLDLEAAIQVTFVLEDS